MKSAPVKRHSVTIKRPATGYDSRGQLTGTDTTVAEEVPCSIEELSGRELELARQNMASATLRVRFFYDPAWLLTTKDYLLRDSNGSRIDIGYIQDREETDLEKVLTCAEEAA